MPAVAYISDQPAASVDASLSSSLAAAEEAHQCAVLWFGDFFRLARRLDELPAVREAVAEGKRDDLVDEVQKVKRAARVDPAQGELRPSGPPVVAARELPVRFQMDLTPEQEARRSALVERLHKLGGVPSDRAELQLEALAILVEDRKSDNTDSHAEKGPRGPNTSRPPVQIHVHEDAATGRMTVQTNASERKLGRADAERMRCDAAVSHPDRRNTTTIPRGPSHRVAPTWQ